MQSSIKARHFRNKPFTPSAQARKLREVLNAPGTETRHRAENVRIHKKRAWGKHPIAPAPGFC
jgi:hypothetical protein